MTNIPFFIIVLIICCLSCVYIYPTNKKQEYKPQIYKTQYIQPISLKKQYDFIKTINFAKELEKRDNKQTVPPHYIYYMFDKKRFTIEELNSMVEQVLKYLPHVEHDEKVVSLITETIIAETGGGYYFDSAGYGGLGIAQVNYRTAVYLLNWLKKNDKKAYKKIINLKNKKLNLRENLVHNISFNIALCVTRYWVVRKEKLYDECNNLNARAKMWKKHYNTSAGLGSVGVYIKRVKQYKKNGRT